MKTKGEGASTKNRNHYFFFSQGYYITICSPDVSADFTASLSWHILVWPCTGLGNCLFQSNAEPGVITVCQSRQHVRSKAHAVLPSIASCTWIPDRHKRHGNWARLTAEHVSLCVLEREKKNLICGDACARVGEMESAYKADSRSSHSSYYYR